MMISDDPDEDAGSFDDAEMVDALLGHPPAAAGSSRALPLDWPVKTLAEDEVSLEPATITWFKARYSDWRNHITLVLRAFIAAQPNGSTAPGPETRT